MQNKLKSVFRRSSRRSSQSSHNGEQPTQATSPHAAPVNQRGGSLDERHRSSSDSAKGDSYYHGRSRPLSSIYNNGRKSNEIGSRPLSSEQAQPNHTEPLTESIANDYHAYLPALSPIGDSNDESYMTLGGDRRLINSESDGKHEEDVADRNIHRYRNSIDATKRKPLPKLPVGSETVTHNDTHRSSVEQTSNGSTQSSKPLSGSGVRHIKGSGRDEIQKVTEQLLEGFVDLRNTEDTDREVKVAAPVIHETVKPHEHEIIQHKIFREIHNYEFHHRIQPVYDLQVLPPRHWTPNPNGDGLVEVSADEFPSTTGDNRRWEIVQKHVPYNSQAVPRHRTKPEIIHHPTTITEEGFERKETTIIYPPTMEDLTDYDGLVQPVHFDHKTGKRWLGEIVHMSKLQGQIDEFEQGDRMNMQALGDHLPEVPSNSKVSPSSTTNPRSVHHQNGIAI